MMMKKMITLCLLLLLSLLLSRMSDGDDAVVVMMVVADSTSSSSSSSSSASASASASSRSSSMIPSRRLSQQQLLRREQEKRKEQKKTKTFVNSMLPPPSQPVDLYKHKNRFARDREHLDFETDISLKAAATANTGVGEGGISCGGKIQEFTNSRRKKIEDEHVGQTLTLSGSCFAGYADGYGALSKFNRPAYLAVTEDKVYVSDFGNRKLRAIDIADGSKLAVRTLEVRNVKVTVPGPICATTSEKIFLVDKEDESVYRIEGRRGTIYEANTRDLSYGAKEYYPGSTSYEDDEKMNINLKNTNNKAKATSLDGTKITNIGIGTRDINGITVHADQSTHKIKGVYFSCKKRNAIFALVSTNSNKSNNNNNNNSNDNNNNINDELLVEQWIAGKDGDDRSESNILLNGRVNTYSKGGFRDSAQKADVLFNEPTGLVSSPDGKLLYVADTRNNRIRAVVIATGETYTIAGNGKAKSIDCYKVGKRNSIVYGNSNRRYSGDGKGTILNIEHCAFDHPVGIAVHPDGQYLFVSELHGQAIRVVSLSQVSEIDSSSSSSYRVEATRVSTLVTNDGCKSSLTTGFGKLNRFSDGYGFKACIGAPNDIALAPMGGALFVADSMASRIRRVSALTPREKHLADRIKRHEEEESNPLKFPKGLSVGWLRLQKPARGSSPEHQIYPSRYFTVFCEFDQEISEDARFDIRKAIRTKNAYVMRVHQEPTSEDCFLDDDLDGDVMHNDNDNKCGPTYSITLKAHEPHKKVEIGLTTKTMQLNNNVQFHVHGGWRSEPNVLVMNPVGGESDELPFWKFLLYFPFETFSGVLNFLLFALLGAFFLVLLNVLARVQDRFPRIKKLVNKKWFPKIPKINVLREKLSLSGHKAN